MWPCIELGKHPDCAAVLCFSIKLGQQSPVASQLFVWKSQVQQAASTNSTQSFNYWILNIIIIIINLRKDNLILREVQKTNNFRIEIDMLFALMSKEDMLTFCLVGGWDWKVWSKHQRYLYVLIKSQTPYNNFHLAWSEIHKHQVYFPFVSIVPHTANLLSAENLCAHDLNPIH